MAVRILNTIDVSPMTDETQQGLCRHSLPRESAPSVSAPSSCSLYHVTTDVLSKSWIDLRTTPESMLILIQCYVRGSHRTHVA